MIPPAAMGRADPLIVAGIGWSVGGTIRRGGTDTHVFEVLRLNRFSKKAHPSVRVFCC